MVYHIQPYKLFLWLYILLIQKFCVSYFMHNWFRKCIINILEAKAKLASRLFLLVKGKFKSYEIGAKSISGTTLKDKLLYGIVYLSSCFSLRFKLGSEL